jgi:hypothetical protein
MTKHEKPKEERLKEGLKILKELLDILKGNDQFSGYVELKERISTWVKDGKAWAGRIELEELDRYLLVDLPKSALKAAEVAFKVNK